MRRPAGGLGLALLEFKIHLHPALLFTVLACKHFPLLRLSFAVQGRPATSCLSTRFYVFPWPVRRPLSQEPIERSRRSSSGPCVTLLRGYPNLYLKIPAKLSPRATRSSNRARRPPVSRPIEIRSFPSRSCPRQEGLISKYHALLLLNLSLSRLISPVSGNSGFTPFNTLQKYSQHPSEPRKPRLT